jgi:cholesterol oxidase
MWPLSQQSIMPPYPGPSDRMYIICSVSIPFFSTIVIGSGFGGSVTASRLAEAGESVCLLERGKPYPPGSFPRSPADISDNFWDPSEGLHGLFNVWSFKGIEALISSGLGGGSLIYANVLLRKDENWFVEPLAGGAEWRWPISRADLDPHYDRVETVLNAQRFPHNQKGYEHVLKTSAMKDAAAKANLDWGLPPLAITFANPGKSPQPGDVIEEPNGNLHGRPRLTCRLCGECDIGCNYGSKNTLDFNYLSSAKRYGAEIRTRCEVRSFGPLESGGYWLDYVYHAPENEGRSINTEELPLTRLHCKRLVVCAGTLGTTYLMLKNRQQLPFLSRTLGSKFCGNGDLLGFFLPNRTDDRRRRLNSGTGPVITSFARGADTADGGRGRGFYIEDGGNPEFVNWLSESMQIWSAVRRVLIFLISAVGRRIGTKAFDADLSSEVRALLGSGSFSRSTLPILGMGRDTPDGLMSLDNNGSLLQLDWEIDGSDEYFSRVKSAMNRMADGIDARFSTNPTYLLRRLITVHPLGGCPMGRTAEEGVVDSFGKVFGYPGLYISDGSVLPGPVGANPSLTIAALADRMVDHMLLQEKDN